MIDCPAVDQLKLHIVEQDVSWPLGQGALTVAIEQGRLRRVGAADHGVRFRVDRGGVWLKVDGVDGVHVNGRHVLGLAMLRPGDAVYVGGNKTLLVREQPVPWPDSEDLDDVTGEVTGDFRVVLRGIGGKHHGRALTLDRPRLVGSAADADLRIDGPNFAQRHAQLTLRHGHVVLRDLDSADGTVLNGVRVRDALLQPGDQVVFGGQHRFVVEAPGKTIRRDPSALPPETVERPDGHGRGPGWWRWPWLLLAALLLAAALASLLLFGAGQ